MNGEKGLEDLLNYITGHKELDLDLDLELEPEGLVRHAQPKEIRKNEKEPKTINRCLQSNGEPRKIQKLKSHDKNVINGARVEKIQRITGIKDI